MISTSRYIYSPVKGARPPHRRLSRGSSVFTSSYSAPTRDVKMSTDNWLCSTCAVQIAAPKDKGPPPAMCAICEDERQYVKAEGQHWTTQSNLKASGHKNVIKQEEPGVLGIGIEPSVAIGQRALLIQTTEGNILWDCIPLLDEAAKDTIRKAGGFKAIAISHPHFYAAMADWADEFDVDIYISEHDKEWVQRPHERIKFWSGDKLELIGGATVIRLGGHFTGSCVLHWEGRDGKCILATGDTVLPVPDQGWCTFMYSYPNMVPLPASQVERIRDTLKQWPFERMYAAWFGKKIESGAAGAVQRSADRYAGILKETIKKKYF